VEPGAVSANRQVHGAEVRQVTEAPDGGYLGRLRDWPEADGLVTSLPGAPLAVLGADCLPVLMWRRDRTLVGAAHAGWRGLVAGVLETAVAELGDPGATGVAIGPGIGPCCYPVSAEVRDRFAARFGDAVLAGEAVDLALAARRALTAAGVPDAAIATVPACTSCEEARFFSYRRDGGGTGRQAGIVWTGEAA
jgi:YfiH family protein